MTGLGQNTCSKTMKLKLYIKVTTFHLLMFSKVHIFSIRNSHSLNVGFFLSFFASLLVFLHTTLMLFKIWTYWGFSQNNNSTIIHTGSNTYITDYWYLVKSPLVFIWVGILALNWLVSTINTFLVGLRSFYPFSMLIGHFMSSQTSDVYLRWLFS